MIRYLTSELVRSVRSQVDYNNSTFFTDEEILGWLQEEYDELHAKIVTLNEDYFLQSMSINMPTDFEFIDFSNMQLFKIRGIDRLYDTPSNGGFQTLRERPWIERGYDSGGRDGHRRGLNYSYEETYSYRLLGEDKIFIYPSGINRGTYIIHYIPNATRMTINNELFDMRNLNQDEISSVVQSEINRLAQSDVLETRNEPLTVDPLGAPLNERVRISIFSIFKGVTEESLLETTGTDRSAVLNSILVPQGFRKPLILSTAVRCKLKAQEPTEELLAHKELAVKELIDQAAVRNVGEIQRVGDDGSYVTNEDEGDFFSYD